MVQGAISRSAMVNAYLTHSLEPANDTEEFVKKLVQSEELKGVGGFSRVCGLIGKPLAVVSNRTPNVEGITWIAEKSNETVGLSNAAFANKSWPQVLKAESLLSSAIAESITMADNKEDLVKKLMALLTVDTLPKWVEGQCWETYVKELSKSIFIPVVGGEGPEDMRADDVPEANSIDHVQSLSASYETRKQTDVLLDHQGRVNLVERTLYGSDGKETSGKERDRWFDFDVEGWEGRSRVLQQ